MEALNTLEDWLAHCERLHPTAIDMGLERVRTVAQRMAIRFDCPVITVAGTNGKGSTCAMLESILGQSGYRTGLFTSPHLVHFEERLRLLGQSVDATNLVAGFEAVERARTRNGEVISLSYFEFSMLAIFDVMMRSGLDVVILEVGLGGRLDSTNIIDTDCAIITSIDLDHMEILGPDRESIGREKAGIMRTGKPVIVSDPVPPQSVLDHAREIDADIWVVGRDFNVSGTSSSGAGPGVAGATAAWPTRRCAGRISWLTPLACWPRWLRCASGCRSLRRPCAMGWHLRVARQVSDHPGPTHAGAGCRPQPAFGGSAGRQSGCHGLFSDHACCFWRHGRQGPDNHAGQGKPADRFLVFHGFAAGTRGQWR
jgi:hypothetical protein